MKTSKASTGPKATLEITDEEKSVAQEIKKEFKESLKKLDKAVKVVVDLRDAISNQSPSKKELNTKYRGRLLRYRKKIKTAFNSFLSGVKASVEKLSKISDPEMIKLREIIISEVGELSDGVESLMDSLGETDREGFTQTLEQIVAQMEKRKKSIIEVIDSQLFNHIDHDILGRMKISELRFKIKRRARIVKQLIREK